MGEFLKAYALTLGAVMVGSGVAYAIYSTLDKRACEKRAKEIVGAITSAETKECKNE